MAIIDPHTTEEQLHQGGDYRSMLGEGPRKAGLKVHMIGANSTKERVEGVILPSFNYALDTCDQAFQQSVGPFWKGTPDPKHPKHFLPNAWAVPLICYTFMGANNEHFISPSNRAQMIGGEDCTSDEKADAFNDLWCSIKFDKSLTDKDKEYFLKKPGAKDDAKIPNRQTRFFSFANLTTKDSRNEPHDAVICYTGASHTHMVEQARWRNEEGDRILDPNWPRYMLGDPTRTSGAMIWTVDKRLLDPKDAQETNCILWTQKRELLDDQVLTRVITPESLAKRFIMIDPSSWNIPTYQEQVDFMLANYHEEVTSEMIRHACGNRADVGERRSRPKSPAASSAAARHDDDDDYNPLTRTKGRETEQAPAKSFAPESTPPVVPVAPTPPVPPVAPTPTVTQKFWVVVDGAAKLVTSAEMPALVVAHGDIATMAEANASSGVWSTASACGFAAVPTPPFVPTPPAVPTAPALPTAPTPPSLPAAAEAAAVSIDDTRRNIFDDATYATLPPEKKAAVDAVVIEMHAVTASGKQMPAEIVDRVIQLMGA